MNDPSDDLMWSHFAPLWEDLRKVGGGNLLLAGGYGLFLKQKWLLENPKVPVIVPIDQWLDSAPRVTKDLDIVIGHDLLAREDTHKGLRDALQRNLFTVIPDNEWWRFERKVSETHTVIVELHAPPSPEGYPNLKTEGRRVKHKPSLGDHGVHARENSEAIGCDLQLFHFDLEGLRISVPNPVTWSLMKLAAMRDRHERSELADESSEDRHNSYEQARKHAQDACRVVAMVTQVERDQAVGVVNALHAEQVFGKARQTLAEFFEPIQGWGTLNTSLRWTSDAFRLIQETLASWYG